ncbi:MAG: hypothetical protein H8D45_27750 [Bacteroidetes bacterium]|nr:hypothetical protein [Bacteroidota bacterium]MBL7105705.1 hypothetical protein [Bacteroidales bacterium]
MKKVNLLSIVIAFIMFSGTINAQNIAISDVTHTADASAVLDVYSTSLGMLVPRMNTAPASPATGLLYYDTGSNSYKYYNGTAWIELSYGSFWSRSGTDTYLSNTGDNVVIGTNTSAPGYKFYVFGATSQMSRFDGQVEFWNTSGGTMDADINDDGLGHGVFNLYDNAGTQRIALKANGNSLFNGGAVCIGGSTPTSLLHIVDNNGFGTPQILLDNISGVANTAVGYKFGAVNFSQGIEPTTNNFVLCNTAVINPPSQSDGASMISAFQSGIIDLNNQSRARVYLSTVQLIQTNTWQPIDFNAMNYDEHSEWTLGAGSPVGGPPVSYFTATEEGYYQVNARTEFYLGGEEDLFWVAPDAYVSIAIYKGNGQGNWNMYAQGNNLQIGQNSAWNPGPDLYPANKYNNAPNVSDVVYLQAGEQIAIYTWQSSGINLNIILGTEKTYCSIHKSS